MNEVVISGIGLVSPWGIGHEKFCFEKINDDNTYKSEINNISIPGRAVYLDKLTKFFLKGIEFALIDSGINSETRENAGICLGSTYGGHELISISTEKMLKTGLNSVPASMLVFGDTNVSATYSSIVYNMKGVNAMITTGTCSSIQAICFSYHQVSFFNSKCIFTGGGDVHSKWIKKFFKGKLEPKEGIGIICLEDKKKVLERNGKIYGKIEGAIIKSLDNYKDIYNIINEVCLWTKKEDISIYLSSNEMSDLNDIKRNTHSSLKYINSLTGYGFCNPSIFGIISSLKDEKKCKDIVNIDIDKINNIVCAVHIKI